MSCVELHCVASLACRRRRPFTHARTDSQADERAGCTLARPGQRPNVRRFQTNSRQSWLARASRNQECASEARLACARVQILVPVALGAAQTRLSLVWRTTKPAGGFCFHYPRPLVARPYLLARPVCSSAVWLADQSELDVRQSLDAARRQARRMDLIAQVCACSRGTCLQAAAAAANWAKLTLRRNSTPTIRELDAGLCVRFFLRASQ